MHEPVIGFPSSSCFPTSTATSSTTSDPSPAAAAAAVTCRSGQSVSTSTYRTKIADKCRLVTLTWSRRNHTHHLLHTLTVSVSSADTNPTNHHHHHHHRHTKLVEIKPWHFFWRRRSGSKRLPIDDDDRRSSTTVEVFWDIRNAGAGGGGDGAESYYVAVVCGGEVAVVVGDLKDEAYRKTGCRPAAIEPTLVSRKEHVFGKKRFETRVRFREKGRAHVIVVEGKEDDEGEMVIRFDGAVGVRVGNLRWKFRGNEVVRVGDDDDTSSRVKVEVYWDVHDWLFNGDGLRRGLFVFKPVSEEREGVGEGGGGDGLGGGNESSESCLFLLYAWKVE